MDDLEARPQRILAAAFLVFALAFAAFGAMAGDTFFLRLATEALILAGLAMAVDVLLGYTGLLSLGHALFFGLGAYVSALVLKHWAPSFWAALGATLAAATLFGSVAGFISIRARGVYFALITFGLAQVVYKAVYNTRELGGSDGILGIPEIQINFGLFTAPAASPTGFFLVVLAFVMLMYLALAYLMRTPFGRALVAIRTNEPRVPFLGYASSRAKLIAFIIAADAAALAGALYPMLRGFVSPDLLAFQASGNALIMVILGGVGTLVGSLYGAVILTALKSVLGTWTEHHLIVIGALFVVSVIFLPKGFAGCVLPRIGRFLGRRA
jgi:branched-chain amino acid transport system permease protein